MLWYGDDDSGSDIRKGGTGKTTPFRGDSFRLTVYDRAFTTPAWLQGAVVYEIFADRFRNGDTRKGGTGQDHPRSRRRLQAHRLPPQVHDAGLILAGTP